MKVLPPKIIFEDESIVVLNKPAGLIVNRLDFCEKKTLQDWLDTRYKKLYAIRNKQDEKISEFLNRSGLVHRLDKETSGVLLVAKSAEAFIYLKDQFKKRQVKKKYLALVHGLVTPESGTIKMALARNPFNRKKFSIFLNGRESLTQYQVLKKYIKIQKNQKVIFSLLEVRPLTGRTHQIRIHFKHLGYPIVGDALYAGGKTSRIDRHWCPRQFLHASFLSFSHPKTLKTVEFTCPLPKDLEKSLSFLTEEA